VKGRPAVLFSVLAVLVLTSGCGTFCNTVYFHPYEGGKRVYGGVRGDCEAVERLAVAPATHETEWDRIRLGIFHVFDMPFSALGDTLTLPYILWIGYTDGFGYLPWDEAAKEKVQGKEGEPSTKAADY